FDPPGYCHFSERLHDLGYFKQLVAEYLKEKESHGRVLRYWAAAGDNHYHDCRIYNMALAEHYGLSRLTDEDWMRIAEVRNVPADRMQADLFDALGAVKPPEPKAAARKPESPAQSTSTWNHHELTNERY